MINFSFLADGQYRTLLDAGVSEEDAQMTADYIRSLGSKIASHRDAVTRIRANRDLSKEGQQRRITELSQETRKAIERGKSLARDLADQAASRRKAAIQGPKPADRDVMTVLAEREVRDRLATLNQTQVAERYLKAITSGDDQLLLSAIENAPKAFPLVSPDVMTRAAELKVEHSPLAGTIRALETQTAILEQATNQALVELG